MISNMSTLNIPSKPLYPSRRSPVMAKNIVSTSHPLASQAGLNMILQGGNAVDAAIAAAITLTVVEPTGCGLGSDAFAIIWDGKSLHGLNASGRSPAAWNFERFANFDKMPFRGWESVTVPGAVSGWLTLSDKFGKLPFENLFEPAIKYANEGFAVTPIISELWRIGAQELKNEIGFSKNFMRKNNTPKAGEIFVNPNLGKSLTLIAETKCKAFYEGELAEAIEHCAIQNNAALSLSDLSQHQNDWCGTISQQFNDFELHEIPPNSQGLAALMALGILRYTEVQNLNPDDPAAIHLQIEAIKLSLADVNKYVSDPKNMKDTTAEDLLSEEYLKQRSQLIDRKKSKDFKSGTPKTGGTVYVTAADKSGQMISFIQSNYAGFGSGVCIPETGIHLQNRGAGFSLDPNSSNVVGPKKRPFHTIIPGFLLRNGQPIMSFGVMGGPMQAQGHVQLVLRTELWGQDPQTAIDAPRWRFDEGKRVAVEISMPKKTISILSDMGHDVEFENYDKNFGFGGAQIIKNLGNNFFIAGSDPRKDGQSVGI